MLNSRLILIEGIPGSGKTTTARLVADWLEKQGKRAVLYQEGDLDHPADFESVACLDDCQYAELRSQFPAQVEYLAKNVQKRVSDYFFSYCTMQQESEGNMPEALFKALACFEIYNLSVEKYQRLLLQHWQDFALRAASQDNIYVFECSFLQNPITTLLARHNLLLEKVHEYILNLSAAIALLDPKMIYLEQKNVRRTLENIRAQRPHQWADYITWYLTCQDYGKNHGLHGFDGSIDFYIIRQALELEFLQTLPIASLVVSDLAESAASWAYVENFLSM